MPENAFKPSKQLYNSVRAGFVQQGTSLAAWCKSHDLKLQNVMTCLIGSWDGPKAKSLRAQVVQAANVRGNGNDSFQ
jgi:hypothetical protein